MRALRLIAICRRMRRLLGRRMCRIVRWVRGLVLRRERGVGLEETYGLHLRGEIINFLYVTIVLSCIYKSIH